MRLGLVFLVLLALVWAIVLFPSLLRARFEGSPIDGVRSFEHAMGILANAGGRTTANVSGRWIMVPRDVTTPRRRQMRIIRRRRVMFQRLLLAAVSTLVLGVIPGMRWLLLVHVALDVAVAVYVARLLQWKRDEQQRAQVVRALPAEPASDPSLDLDYRSQLLG